MSSLRTRKTDKDVEKAVVAYVQTMSSRILDLMGKMEIGKELSESPFSTPSYDDFSAVLKAREQDYRSIPLSETVCRIFDIFCPAVGVYLKDVNTAKVLLSVIFETHAVDRDVKLGHDALKEAVLNELHALESSIKKSIEFCEEFHMYRAEKSIEGQLNAGAEDLGISLWIVENQASAQTESAMLQMVMGYFELMETIRETYDMLQLPGIIGHRKSKIKSLRNDLYG